MNGLWVFVCGASGAGKDSVMAWAAEYLQNSPRVVFARRMVTRAAHAGSDHDAITSEQFAQLQAAGALAWHWQAHEGPGPAKWPHWTKRAKPITYQSGSTGILARGVDR